MVIGAKGHLGRFRFLPNGLIWHQIKMVGIEA